MKNSHMLALAAALAGSAIAYGLHILGKGDTVQTAPAGHARLKSASNEQSRFPTQYAAGSDASNRLRSGSGIRNHSLAASSAAIPEFQPHEVGGSPQATGGSVMSESEWHEHAAKVEMEANHELNRLTTLLNLDATQQEKVFSSLAQRSSSWRPGMQTGTNLGAVSIGSSAFQPSGSVAASSQGQISSNGMTARNADGTISSTTTAGQTDADSRTRSSGNIDDSPVSIADGSTASTTTGQNGTGTDVQSQGRTDGSPGLSGDGATASTTTGQPSGSANNPNSGATDTSQISSGAPSPGGPTTVPLPAVESVGSVASTATGSEGPSQSPSSPTPTETVPTSPVDSSTESSPSRGDVAATGPVDLASVDPTIYLTQEQQDTLIEDAMDSEAWWAEILPQLLPPTITELPPETLDFDGGEVLLEE